MTENELYQMFGNLEQISPKGILLSQRGAVEIPKLEDLRRALNLKHVALNEPNNREMFKRELLSLWPL